LTLVNTMDRTLSLISFGGIRKSLIAPFYFSRKNLLLGSLLQNEKEWKPEVDILLRYTFFVRSPSPFSIKPCCSSFPLPSPL